MNSHKNWLLLLWLFGSSKMIPIDPIIPKRWMIVEVPYIKALWLTLEKGV